MSDDGLISLFADALACSDPASRAAFLDRACGGDADRRRRVDALLAAHDRAGAIVTSPDDATRSVPAVGDAEEATAAFGPPATFARAEIGSLLAGRYRLVDVLGEGGMGTVYRAEQIDPVRREVAVKLIRSGFDSAAVLARFDAERQALALMDHPNIAKVYDGGTTDRGAPFFVMELVRGVPLTTYCDGKRLPVRARIDLFVSVCRAVQHAHQKGVIHRDLKPSNVLVGESDGRPVAKVIDFGVAKATDRRLTDLSLADTNAIVGTPAYMSPEQADPASHDVDTRTDVYALGVILYELLAGSPPIDTAQFRRGAVLEMLRMVREVDPPRPSTKLSTAEARPNIAANRGTEPAALARLLRGELDWVVMKAIEKEKARRYDSASDLARDLERYLADEVVEARPPGAGYRFRKFVRRNRGPVAAAAGVAAALLAGVAGTGYGLVQARTEAEAATAARNDEAAQRALAEAANVQAYAALKAFTDDLMGQLLGGRSRLTATERAILENARTQWEVFARSKGTSESARAVRGDGAENLALVQSKLGLPKEAEENYRLALAVRTDLLAEFPENPRYRVVVPRSHQNLGTVLRLTGRLPEAEAAFRNAADGYAALVAASPGDDEVRRRLADSLISLGNACRDRGDFVETERHYRASLAHNERLASAHPDDPKTAEAVGRSYWGLAFLSKRQRKLADGEAHYRRAIREFERLVAAESEKPEGRENLGNLRRELGTLLTDHGDPAGALREFDGAIALLEGLATRFPSVPQYRVGLARALRDLGQTLGRLGRGEDASHALTRSADLFGQLVRDLPTALMHRSDLGLTEAYLADQTAEGPAPEASLPRYDAAIATLRYVIDRNPAESLTKRSLGRAYAGKAATLERLGRFDPALAEWDEALRFDGDERKAGTAVARATTRLLAGQGGTAFASVADAEKSDAPPAFDLARFYAVAAGRDPARRDEFLAASARHLVAVVPISRTLLARVTADAEWAPVRNRAEVKAWLARGAAKFPPPRETLPKPVPQ